VSNESADARQITRASKSNLALAFVSLPRGRREDITVFYAWCRVIDDLADDPGASKESRARALDHWKRALEAPVSPEPPLAPPVRALRKKYQLTTEHFLEIIAGVEMDLDGASYETWEDLRLYCYRVASAVGLISIEIFGCRDPASREYAVALGLALQLTNILRDVGEDWRNGGRIYLPREDLARFGYTAEDLAAERRTPAFLQLMEFQAERAQRFYEQADALKPASDRHALVAAEIMRRIYGKLLSAMQRDGFRIFGKRYRLTKWQKLTTIFRTIVGAKFS
jgi:phytoene synthase